MATNSTTSCSAPQQVIDGSGFGGITEVNASNFVRNPSGAATDAGDRFIYGETARTLYFDPDGAGAAAAVMIAHIVGLSTLSTGDFVIV